MGNITNPIFAIIRADSRLKIRLYSWFPSAWLRVKVSDSRQLAPSGAASAGRAFRCRSQISTSEERGIGRGEMGEGRGYALCGRHGAEIVLHFDELGLELGRLRGCGRGEGQEQKQTKQT